MIDAANATLRIAYDLMQAGTLEHSPDMRASLASINGDEYKTNR
jgi:hypothetical protein